MRPGAPHASLVLPIHNQAEHVTLVVQSFLAELAKLERPTELVLVPNGCRDASPELCAELAARHPESVQVVPLERGGWGRAVNAGLEAARGELVGYTNSARTTPATAMLMLAYAFAYPNVVLKATRRSRESMGRKLGSVIYNFECRRLFDLGTWDVDGTPKLFPRSFHHLLRIDSRNDLFDLELLRACRYAGYPVIEVPVQTTDRFGGRSTTRWSTAARLLWGAYRLRSEELRPRLSAGAGAPAATAAGERSGTAPAAPAS
jgi:glycosyltransferase involved in cell wall biosynthesis